MTSPSLLKITQQKETCIEYTYIELNKHIVPT